MEMLDEYQDSMAQTVAGDVAVANMAHHRHTPDSPLSHQEEDLSDPDRQDEESGEELIQQPMQGNNHSSTDNTPAPTPLAHLNALAHPHFLAKIKLENDMDMLNNKSGLEALQAAMSGGGFNLPFSFPAPGAFLAPGQQQQQGQHPGHSSSSNNHGQTSSNNGGGAGIGSNLPSSASSHSSESSQGSGRNGLETTSQRESAPGGGTGGNGSVHSQSGSQSQQSAHQQQTSWSFEEQFKQVRQKMYQMQEPQPTPEQNGKEFNNQSQDNWGSDESLNKSVSNGNNGTSNKSNTNETTANLLSKNSEQMQLNNQLYEINDDPKRKDFLDDLFSFMQKRGTPINRLPIMAKSVLDLYELYNLVIARGGLVDVINKKLWQEIIKGLHLPSSITSAAFTLRTQYMKYLYPYECEKKHLSTPNELQAAIDGNRREGRRSNYGAYTGGSGGVEGLVRSAHTPGSLASLHAQMSPLSLVTAVQQAAAAGGQHQIGPQGLMNGSAAHTPLPHHPHHPQHQQGALGQPPNAGIAPELEVRMAEYMKQLQRDLNRRVAGSPTNMMNSHRPNSPTPPPPPPPGRVSPTREQAAFLEMSRLTLWNMYNNNLHPAINYAQPPSPHHSSHSPHAQPASPEPQKEALDLGLRSSPSTSSPTRQSPPSSSGSIPVKREAEHISSPTVSANKRLCMEEDGPSEAPLPALPGTHIKISNRGDGRDKSLVVSMELNGVVYQGVLFAQTDGSVAANNNETKASSRNVVS